MNVFSPILSFFQAFFSSLHTNQNTETRLFSGEGATSRKNHMSNTDLSEGSHPAIIQMKSFLPK